MCCGNRITTNNQKKTTTTTWQVLDTNGKVVATKTSEIAAKLAAARIGGTIQAKKP
jgi:hypothetical protein